MKFKLYSREEKADGVTLHFTPATEDAVPLPQGVAWSRIWQSNAKAELQMDVAPDYAAKFSLGAVYSLG